MQHNETLEAKRLSGNSGYDVVVPSNASTGREASAMTGSLKYSGSLDA